MSSIITGEGYFKRNIPSRMRNLATEENFARLNVLIEDEDNQGIYDFFMDIIHSPDRGYTAGKKEEHTRSLDAIMVKYRKGMWPKEHKERWAKNEMVTFFGNVAGLTL